MDKCTLCGSRGDLHTHHIKEQHTADDNNMIEHFHKNKEFNLLVLCNKCHSKIHHYDMKVEKLETLNGTYLSIN